MQKYIHTIKSIYNLSIYASYQYTNKGTGANLIRVLDYINTKGYKRIRLRIVRRLHAAFVHFKAKQVTAVFRGQRGQGVRKIAHIAHIHI